MDSEQRKRALEALDRRCEAARAERLHHQNRDKCKSDPESPKHKDAAASPTGTSSRKKGRSFFSSHAGAPQRKGDAEENGPAYLQLSHPVDEHLIIAADSAMLQNKQVTVADKVLHELLQHGDSARKYKQGSRSMKIDDWILLDNFVKGRAPSTSSHVRALQTHSKRSKKHMSMKQHKKCGTLGLPQDFQKFDIFKPMHEMWKGYIAQLLKITGQNQLAQCLLSADLHGAIVLVVDSKMASYIGVSGIMIRETAETFGIITQDDKFRVVPKRSSVFVLQVDCWKVTMHGEKLTSRSLSL